MQGGRMTALLLAMVFCMLVVPVVRGCDNLAAGSCALSRDSCRYPGGSSVNDNACSECWPTYFACVKTADCEDDSFYGSTAITTCASTDSCNSTVCAFPDDSASVALRPQTGHALGSLVFAAAAALRWD